MTDEVNPNSEVQEVATQVETGVSDESSRVSEAHKAKQEADERNWKAMRIKNAELEKELKQMREMQMQIMQAQLANSAPAKQEVDELDAIGDDEYLPKGKVKKLLEKQARNLDADIDRKVEEKLHKQSQSQFLDKLNRQYSDFNDVVNPETLSLLEEKEPELAQTIADLKDPYKIGIQSYKYIKAMGLVEKAPEARRQKEVEKAVEKAEKAIPSPSSFDKRPIAQAFKMTDAMKKDLYREMMGAASMAGAVPEMS